MAYARNMVACIVSATVLAQVARAQTNYVVVAWNNLGMHCMDSDYSVFSILPPYNTIHAQIIARVAGQGTHLVTLASDLGVTYEAVADADGSYNATSVGKGNFWTYAQPLFGIAPAPDTGLPVPGPEPYRMPGPTNAPQAMAFESALQWYAAYGVPISPYDDAGKPNQYPMMRIRVRDAAGVALTHTDIVLPVSDEMDCRLCHASGSGPDARPAAGWVRVADPGRDYRLNILRLHDERHGGTPLYTAALEARGFAPEGLHASVVSSNHPVLCASCHLSEALPATGYGDIRPLTEAIHGAHATVLDPRSGLTLDAAVNRQGCYSCHPGSTTRCLRGAMGSAVAPNGTRAMQCQSCHGTMADVASPARTGWLDEPNCQACHTGDAVSNSGKIRFLDAMTNGALRTTSNTRFATSPNTPETGFSLYRFSTGHGNLQCSACHGSTHAIYPSITPNDNVQSMELQGHAGVLSECSTCHMTTPSTTSGGPHGMHPPGEAWARDHADIVEDGGVQQCRACHGTDDRGTVLSRALADRTITTKFGTRTYWRGQQIGCYNCHDGVDASDPSTHGVPSVSPVVASVDAGRSVAISLAGTGVQSYRIVAQPVHGTVGLSGAVATYHADTDFAGVDTFTFAGSNGYNESDLATGTVTVSEPLTNGIPVWWVETYFPTNTLEACATCDPDGDGLNNSNEYVAGTHPLDARRNLRMVGAAPTPDAGTEVRFTTELGKQYDIARSTDLDAATWSNIVVGLWGQIDSTAIHDSNATPRAFYRARARP